MKVNELHELRIKVTELLYGEMKPLSNEESAIRDRLVDFCREAAANELRALDGYRFGMTFAIRDHLDKRIVELRTATARLGREGDHV